MNLEKSNFYTFSFGFAPVIDSEHKEIMARLRAYGESPTGDKATDRAKLRRIEEKKAKENNIVTGKFLTVSKGEEERIQERKKEKRDLSNPEKIQQKKEANDGAKALGEQLFLVTQLNNKKYKKEKIEQTKNNPIIE